MSIYKAYDIRGIYGKELTERDAYLLGYYLPKYLNINEIKIAHDLRLSQEKLTKYLISGLLDSNCEIIYLGTSSTPNFYFSLFVGVNSGIMITASHNPKEYNGFKLMYDGNSFDSSNGMYELERLVKEDKDNKVQFYEQIKETLLKQPFEEFLEEHEISHDFQLNNYIGHLIDFYHLVLTENERDILEKITFGLDFSSGVSSLAVVPFLKQTKLNFNLYNEIPDGNFPVHSPDPMKATEFLKSVKENNDFIATFDGDGDRIVFYDENKDLILPDYTIATYVDFFINQNHKTFVCDLRVSRTISDLVKQNKGKFYLMRVGRAFYKGHMDKNHCVYGAELSGHFFFRDFHNFDNPDFALIFMLKIVAQKLLKNRDITFSQIIEKYKTYHKIQETNLKVTDADSLLANLRSKYEDNLVLEMDGLSFDFKDYWFNVRKSNTEPVIKINFEGLDKKTTLEEFNKLVRIVKKV